MRKAPQKLSAAVTLPPAKTHAVCKSYDIELITPMLGGGVLVKETDPISPIRVPAVLGHLRFWWRATVGRDYDDLVKLRTAESALWGSMDVLGQVFVKVDSVTLITRTEAPQCLNFRSNLGKLTQYRFRLTVACPEAHKGHVEKAIRAWCNLGGIGAATRRGFGALHCPTLPLDSSLFCQSKLDRPWTILLAGPLPKKKADDAASAWRLGVELLHSFRQGDGVGRNGRRRSYWPEADSLRALSNKGDPAHARATTLKALQTQPRRVGVDALEHVGFPRAAFGLPIVFQFPRQDSADHELEATLTAAESHRLASCLIVRPYKTEKGYYHSMILRLHQPPVNSARLTFTNSADWNDFPSAWKGKNKNGEDKGVTLGADHVRGKLFAQYDNSPLGPPRNQNAERKPGKAKEATPPRSETGDAIEAFLAYAKEEGWQ